MTLSSAVAIRSGQLFLYKDTWRHCQLPPEASINSTAVVLTGSGSQCVLCRVLEFRFLVITMHLAGKRGVVWHKGRVADMLPHQPFMGDMAATYWEDGYWLTANFASQHTSAQVNLFGEVGV